MDLSSEIKLQALALGFDLARVIPMQRPGHAAAFVAWLAAGMQGEMGYLAERRGPRLDPALLAPGVRQHRHAGGQLQSRPDAAVLE